MTRLQPNLFGDSNGLYRKSATGVQYFSETFSPGWAVDPPSTLTVVDDVFRSSQRFSLRLTNSTSGNIVISATQTSISQPHAFQNLIFNCMVLSSNKMVVNAYLHKPDLPYTSVEPNVQTTTAGVWSPIFSNELVPDNEVSPETEVKITLIIEVNSTNPVFFTSPNLTYANPDEFNQFAILSQQFFPDVVREIDSQQTNPSRPLMKFYHSLTAHASGVMDEYVRIFKFDNDEMGPRQFLLNDSAQNLVTRSEMTDPALMTSEYIRWAAMFVGTRIITDVQVSGTSILVDPSFEFDRWQVTTKAFGFASGNRESIKAATRIVLGGSQSVLVTPLWDGDPWTIMIRTLTSETPGVSAEGDTSDEVLAIANLAKPAGYVLEHTVVDEFSFILNDPDFGVFDQSILG